MDTKICRICNKNKELTEFYLHNKNGCFRTECKECLIELHKTPILVPKIGYIKGNICVISWRANSLKNNAKINELEKILEYMKQNNCE